MAIYIQKLGYTEEPSHKFVCWNCKCEWLADVEEVHTIIDELNHGRDNTYTMDCPCCGKHAFSSERLTHRHYLSPRTDIQSKLADLRVEVIPLTGP